MNKYLYTLFLCCFLGFWGINTQAQEGFVLAGGVSQSSDGSVSYSVGQLNFVIQATIDGTVNPGLQQPFLGSPTPVIDNLDIAGLRVYPNPTTANVLLEYSGKIEPLRYLIYDLHGKQVAAQSFEANQFIIPFQQFANGVYMLYVKNAGDETKTFKIIKNQ
jgi:hypothetical protein